jgi:hypothetical protein
MSFSCRHIRLPQGDCLRLGRPCVPAQAGCVLAGKAMVLPASLPRRRRRSRRSAP